MGVKKEEEMSELINQHIRVKKVRKEEERFEKH